MSRDNKKEMTINYLDLFSGIGGFALGLQMAGFKFNKHYFSEVEEYGTKLYSSRFSRSIGLGDIRNIRGSELETIDILTGGFPCQPFSVAGKQKGAEDNRYLWPEMLRLIIETKPTWIIGENVTGIIKLALDEVLSSLENEGYSCQTLIIPACAVNASHRRDRVWILANSLNSTDRAIRRPLPEKNGVSGIGGKKMVGRKSSGTNNNASNADNRRQKEQEQQTAGNKQCGGKGVLEHSQCIYSQGSGAEQDNTRSDGLRYRKKFGWEQNWLEVAAALCGVDDGVSAELDGFKLSKAGHRVSRLKGLGNAVVPQIVAEIGKAILESTEQDKCIET